MFGCVKLLAARSRVCAGLKVSALNCRYDLLEVSGAPNVPNKYDLLLVLGLQI